MYEFCFVVKQIIFLWKHLPYKVVDTFIFCTILKIHGCVYSISFNMETNSSRSRACTVGIYLFTQTEVHSLESSIFDLWWVFKINFTKIIPFCVISNYYKPRFLDHKIEFFPLHVDWVIKIQHGKGKARFWNLTSFGVFLGHYSMQYISWHNWR